MATTLCHASIDERGRIKGGAAGDQTGREVCTRAWWSYSWDICLIYPDAKVREQAAAIAKKLAVSNLIGYDQYQRNTLYQKLKKYNWDVDAYIASKEKSETDCSAFVYACYCCLVPSMRSDVNAPVTANMRSKYKDFGFKVATDSKYKTTSDYLDIGYILVNEGHHTVMNITKGSKVVDPSATEKVPSNEKDIVFPSRGYYMNGDGIKINTSTVYKNNIKKIQTLVGFKGDQVDGQYGGNTKAWVMAWQEKMNLKKDGEFGKKSADAAGWKY